MAKKKDPRGIRKLTKVGGHTISVSIPIHLVRELKWRERQKVVVSKRGGCEFSRKCIDLSKNV